MIQRTPRQKGIVVLAILDRQIQEAHNPRHLGLLMTKLARFAGTNLKIVLKIYETQFVHMNKGYLSRHPDRGDELGAI